MSTLPTLPVCGRPATIRIEAYSPLDGQPYGTLDASVYVCPSHADQTATALQEAGFAVHRLAGGDGTTKRCGDGLDATDPADIRTLTAPAAPAELPFTLPACEQPATIRIEAYSTAPGEPTGSLDASIYACGPHVDDILATIRAADMNPYRVLLAPDSAPRVCGYVHVFATGRLSGHPAWCDLSNCERRREHCSPVVEVDGVHREPLIIHVMLIQSVRPGAVPMLSMTVVDGGGRAPVPVSEHMMMPLDQAAVLADKIRSLIDAAIGGAR
ncbi:hypothetical protein Vqi01_06580 [Micromonospora qiuiae]|uniref:Uncharacterized protein n=1 Tax=Micromonospora qiuiae TaxID=502268 RepID=A0ABQ4J5R1_9ACTN|nr:hypothetical protein [Micromonospora qiuiae]GIJ25496.1 hypothetical protein Vqi01_06580 [Micromonospora qiuiae]